MIINQCWVWNKNLLSAGGDTENNSAWEWGYDKLPSYYNMVYSFKPLRPIYWLEKESYDKLFPETIID